MILQNLRLAWRQLVKYRLQSTVSVISLGIGFACFALAMLWIRYEQTYDMQHAEAERLYVVMEKSDFLNSRARLGEYLASQLPEVAQGCGIRAYKNLICIDGIKHFYQHIRCDSSFLSLMRVELVEGNADFWMHKNQRAVTQKFATRMWGTESAIGKKLQSSYNDDEYTVTAVVRGYGKHSNFPFDILEGDQKVSKWSIGGYETLVRLHPNVDEKAFLHKIDTLRIRVENYDYSGLKAVPLTELRQLKTNTTDTDRLGSGEGLIQFRHIRLIALAGALLILSGLLNYLTMFINRIIIRRREVVLRTTLGGTTWNIMGMFFTEYLLLLIIALGCGLFFMEALLPWFQELTGVSSTRSAIYAEATLYSLAVMLAGFLLSVPAISYFHRRSVQHTLQGRGVQHTYQSFRKASVVVQLIISIGFIFCTAVMMKQLETLRHTDPGFRRDNMAVLQVFDTQTNRRFAQHLNEMPDVEEWFNTYPLFPRLSMVTIFLYPEEGDKIKDAVECHFLNEKRKFLQFYGIRLKEGNWVEDNSASHDIVVNEALLKALNITDPIGKKLRGYGKQDIYTIVGVIEDFYYQAPTVPASPHVFCNNPDIYSYGRNLPYIFRYREGTWKQVKAHIESLLEKQAEGKRIYSLWNCEEEFDKLIASELTLRKLMTAVSLVCILISLFGVWSMIMLNCEQRRKEIAVRKVFGATAGNILWNFFHEYMLLLLIATAIAFPIGYLCMKSWVEQYVIQTSVPWWLYAGIFLATALLVTLCIGWRVWKTAHARPAEEISKG